MTPTPERARFQMSGGALIFILLTAISLGVFGLMYFASAAKKRPTPAIAVLPFRNANADPNAEVFSDGFTIDLIEAMSKIETLRVASWNSVASFRGKTMNAKQLKEQLDAAAVIEGSVIRDGARLQVSARLTRADTGEALWSQNWTREGKDVFKIQEEIAKSVVFALRVQMDEGSGIRLGAAPAKSLDAYDHYLRARALKNRTPEASPSAIEEARKAIERDPEYAPAYALLASSLDGHAARQPATQALKLDPRSAEARAALGLVLSKVDWNFKEARTEFTRSIEDHPGLPASRCAYAAGYLLPMGKLEDAEAQLRPALRLDPCSYCANDLLGYVLLSQPGKEAEAVQQYDKALAMYPGDARLRSSRAVAQAFADHKEATLTRADPRPLDSARTYAVQGDKEKAFAALEDAFKQHDPELAWIKTDRFLASLKSDARFAALAARIGLQ